MNELKVEWHDNDSQSGIASVFCCGKLVSESRQGMFRFVGNGSNGQCIECGAQYRMEADYEIVRLPEKL